MAVLMGEMMVNRPYFQTKPFDDSFKVMFRPDHCVQDQIRQPSDVQYGYRSNTCMLQDTFEFI